MLLLHHWDRGTEKKRKKETEEEEKKKKKQEKGKVTPATSQVKYVDI